MFAAIIALLGALVYGGADFLGGIAAKRVRSIVVTAVAAASGLILLIALYPVVGGVWRPVDVAWGAASGVFGLLGVLLLYACLALGPMSILSPLTAVASAIAPMLWGLIVKGESLSPIGYAGLGVALVAVVLVGFIPGAKTARPSARGLLMALGAGISIGAFLVLIDHTSAESGLVPLLANRAVNALITGAIVGTLLLLAARRGSAAASVVSTRGSVIGAMPSGHADLERAHSAATGADSSALSLKSAWWLAIACGVLDATANATLLFALRIGDLSVVSALTAMYPAGTILLAAVVLRERIAPIQWIGLALALSAGAMLAVA